MIDAPSNKHVMFYFKWQMRISANQPHIWTIFTSNKLRGCDRLIQVTIKEKLTQSIFHHVVIVLILEDLDKSCLCSSESDLFLVFLVLCNSVSLSVHLLKLTFPFRSLLNLPAQHCSSF